MDRYVTATEANQRFSELLNAAEDGEIVTITRRGKSVVQMVPMKASDKKKSLAEFYAKLKALPVIHAGNWKREDLYDRSDRDLP